MNREIKFRSWDNRHVMSKQYYSEKWEEEEDRVLMQYTGLKDKNGKEIYEGDILEIDDFYDGDVKIRECKVVVIFTEGTFCLFLNDEYLIDLYAAKSSANVKIIGNLYENPELLV